MTHKQFESMSKEELNAALTQFMGGLTQSNLKHTKKEELILLLQGFHKQKAFNVTSPKKSALVAEIKYFEILEKLRTLFPKANFNETEKQFSVKPLSGRRTKYLRAKKNGQYSVFEENPSRTTIFSTLEDAIEYIN